MSSRLFVFNEERVTECLTILGEREDGVRREGGGREGACFKCVDRSVRKTIHSHVEGKDKNNNILQDTFLINILSSQFSLTSANFIMKQKFPQRLGKFSSNQTPISTSPENLKINKIN